MVAAQMSTLLFPCRFFLKNFLILCIYLADGYTYTHTHRTGYYLWNMLFVDNIFFTQYGQIWPLCVEHGIPFALARILLKSGLRGWQWNHCFLSIGLDIMDQMCQQFFLQFAAVYNWEKVLVSFPEIKRIKCLLMSVVLWALLLSRI